MLTELVRPGEKIEIQAVEKAILGASSNKKVYTSRIYDILDEEQLEILMPMEGSKLILLPIDGEYQFCFYTKKGLYQCFIRVIDRYKSNNVFILLCELTSPIRKHQRREYYRYGCILPLKTRELMTEEEKALEKNQFQFQEGLPLAKGSVIDISGGGIRFMSGEKYEAGAHIALTFHLMINEKEQVYNLAGEILSCKENELNRGEYECRLKFVCIDNAKREEIIRYIFEEERKKRKRV